MGPNFSTLNVFVCCLYLQVNDEPTPASEPLTHPSHYSLCQELLEYFHLFSADWVQAPGMCPVLLTMFKLYILLFFQTLQSISQHISSYLKKTPMC